MAGTDTYKDVFRTAPKSPQSKHDINNEIARATIKAEADERAARTVKLRAARLEMEAEQARLDAKAKKAAAKSKPKAKRVRKAS